MSCSFPTPKRHHRTLARRYSVSRIYIVYKALRCTREACVFSIALVSPPRRVCFILFIILTLFGVSRVVRRCLRVTDDLIRPVFLLSHSTRKGFKLLWAFIYYTTRPEIANHLCIIIEALKICLYGYCRRAHTALTKKTIPFLPVGLSTCIGCKLPPPDTQLRAERHSAARQR